MSIPGTLETVVQLLGLALLHFLWQGLLLWLLFALMMRLLAPAPALARYYCALTTLGLMLLAPVVTFWWLFAGDRATVVGAMTAAATEGQVFAVAASAPAASLYSLEWLPWVAVAWLAGVFVLALRMVLDARYLLWLKRSADVAVPAALADAMVRLCRQLQLSEEHIRVVITPHVSTALVVGWLRPVVVLPAAIITRMPQQQLELVLAHELAHIRRFDPLVNFLQAVAETLLFYHPMVRIVSRRIRVERENCTDDLVVNITHNRIGYARALTALEELRDSSLRLSVGVTDGDFALRIRRLFRAAPRHQKGMLSAGLVLTSTALLALLAGLGMAQLPQLSGDDEVKPVAMETPMPAREIQANEILRQREQDDLQHQAQRQRQLELQREHEESQRLQAEAARVREQAEARRQAELQREQAELAREREQAQRREAERQQAEAERRQDELARERENAERRQAELAGERGEAGSRSIEETRHREEPRTDQRNRELNGVDLESALAMVPARPGIETQADAVTPELTGGRLIHMAPPEYPAGAMRRGVETEVRLSFVVDAKGRPRDIEVLGGDHERYRFGQAAVRAVHGWRFEPFAHDGRPVERRVEQVVAFNLPGDGAECAPRTGTRINARRDC